MKMTIVPDKEKAGSLVEMAQMTLERLQETDQRKYPTNTLTDYYDSIHKLLEALSYIQGVKIKGEGAHQELIDYICKNYNLSEAQRIFLQELRDYRNRISYEGFKIGPLFLENNLQKIEEIIIILKKLIKK